MRTKLDEITERFAHAFFCDAGVPGEETRPAVAASLVLDVGAGAPLPSDEEVDLLVMGGEDGLVPADLRRRYPSTDAALGALL